jgi:hypothetical protein
MTKGSYGRNYLYKLLIDDATDICYRNSLEYFPRGSIILDVGIGNGIMISRYHGLSGRRTSG